MKKPSAASLKRVTPDNLARLGADRLAAILIAAADLRPELKRRLRMELAADQGAPHLLLEIDKRLTTIAGSKARVSWRQRPTFVGELDALRGMIAERLADLDLPQAIGRMWAFMGLGRSVLIRVKDKDGELEAVFARAAEQLGDMLGRPSLSVAGAVDAGPLLEAMIAYPGGWSRWLAPLLKGAPASLAAATLDQLAARSAVTPGRLGLVRQLADSAGDIDAFASTFSADALRTPSIAAEIARRLLVVGRTAEAGAALEAGRPLVKPRLLGVARAPEPDFDWESVWIDYLEAAGQGEAAQEARWMSFERTLSVERARAFIKRLGDFDDVEAESRAFAHAARHVDFHRGLAFLMAWPSLPEAAKMIEKRADDITAVDEEVEAWAARLSARQPAAAHLLLRREAAVAFRRRDLATAERLTQEADGIEAG